MVLALTGVAAVNVAVMTWCTFSDRAYVRSRSNISQVGRDINLANDGKAMVEMDAKDMKCYLFK